jgi:uncharacterized protein YbjT (DUF2867 family)
MKSVVIAGATGFIGKALAKELAGEYRVIGLTRRQPSKDCPDIEWRHCDLFSLFECEQALAGAEAAFYLVHSMLPSARLTQGNFQDMDLISADNFARAAAQVGIGHIIYLGGLIPEGADISRHIQSRREVEQTLGAHGVPVTTLRAGIVIGLRGSSYGMFRSVLERAPLVFCPWPWLTPSISCATAWSTRKTATAAMTSAALMFSPTGSFCAAAPGNWS